MGRARKLSDADAESVRLLYYSATAPNGSRYSYAKLARLYRVSEGTIQHAVARTGAYSVDEPNEGKRP